MQQDALVHSVPLLRRLPLALLPFLTGCVITAPMWEAANNRTAEGPAIIGVIEPHASNARASNGRALLVIRYSLNFDDDLYTTIPLTPQGRPIEPYDYAGDERRLAAIVNDLPEAWRQQLRETRLVLHSEKWAERVKTEPHFRGVDWTTDGSRYRDVLFEEKKDQARTCRYDVRVRAFRLGRPWTETEEAAMRVDDRDARTFPADSRVLLLPYAQPRPEAHLRKARWRATLLTPVALVGDVLVIPVALFGLAIGQPP